MPCVDDREAFLQQANIAVLSTVDAKGRPHAAPVWYFYEDGVFTISTDRSSRKHKNIEANANVALTIDKRDLPYFAVMVHGRAELGPMFSPEERLRLAIRYLGEERGRRYVEHTKSEDSITIRLRPAKVVEYHGRFARPAAAE
jgi:PPOX class probable F420-dependent enzyme